jgi:DNA polymerase-3 subunit beta
MTATLAKPATPLHVDRQALLLALERVARVINARSCKPILQGVRLEACDGQLQLAATDLDVSIITNVAAIGELPRCVVSCTELTKRVKASKTSDCCMQLDAERNQLVVNGGSVEHVLHTLDAAEFPFVLQQGTGQALRVSTQELKAACRVALIAVAKEVSRYALNGVLLESDGQGTRLVATDGRRLVLVELEKCESAYTGQAILPGRFVSLIGRIADPKEAEFTALHVESQPDPKDSSRPAKLFAAGPGWLLSTSALEGRFPCYRDVLPRSGQRFVVDREVLLAALDEVALATDFERKAITVELGPERVGLCASSAGNSTATGSVPATSPNASPRRIRTGFNARLLVDAVKSLGGESMVIDVQPNQRSKTHGDIIQKPALFYAEHAANVRWLIMPVHVGPAPSKRKPNSSRSSGRGTDGAHTAQPTVGTAAA